MDAGFDTRDALVGKVLRGSYLLQEKISEGSAGTVYRALHTALDAPFAVKILRRDAHVDAAEVARFRREARALSRLRHPNLVSVTDFGETEDGMLFVAMDWVTGRSLSRVIADDAPLPPARVAAIGAQILGALGEAHARQILHGALTPAKVLLESRRDAPEAVKVLDFGVANVQLGAAATAEASAAPYLSPERREGGDLDARSDLYSVGAILLELLTGRAPPDGPAPAPASGLEAVLLRALSRHRHDRPESADEMASELRRCAPAADGSAPEPDDCGPTAVLPRQGARAAPPPAVPSSTRTRATQALRTRRPPDARRPGTPQSGTRRAAGGALPDETVREVERRALATLGPVATVLVSRAASVARTVEDLCEIVASFIPADAERKAFLAAAAPARRPTPAPAARTPPPRAPVAWDPALLDDAARALAQHLGPVARVVVKRTSARARTPAQLLDLLARELPDDASRTAFRRALAAHAGPS